MKHLTAKLGNMRKTQEWVVYPASRTNDNSILIQCDNRIASFNPQTGAGILSDGKNGHQGFHKLNAFMGAKSITVPQDIIDSAIAAQPQSGDAIGSTGVVRIA